MATPRRLLVDPENECDYHLVSRCVRRSFLCGVDGDRDYSHRRGWLIERMRQLAPCFAVDVYAYTVLSNHFHLVLRHDPLADRGWSDEEVAWRWFEAFPPTEHGAVVQALKPERRELMLDSPDRVARARRTLGSMSDFMKHLKQPIARRANIEDDCTGHFFEQRFYSGALLTEEALIAAMAYVDLNPVRAKLAKHIEKVRDTSICERLRENSADALADYLRPIVSGLGTPSASGATPETSAAGAGRAVREAKPPDPQGVAPGSRPDTGPEAASAGSRVDCPEEGSEKEPGQAGTPEPEDSVSEAKATTDDEAGPAGNGSARTRRPRPAVTLAEYIALVRALAEAETAARADPADAIRRWMARTSVLRKRQRAFGTAQALRQWLADRNLQFRESPLPA